MVSTRGLISWSLISILLLAARPAHAQVGFLGKGWSQPSGVTITSTPGEVISGKYSIKVVQSVFKTDSAIIHFRPGQTYTITANYRALENGSQGGVNFGSTKASRAGVFPDGVAVSGSAGASGIATVTVRTVDYDDYQLNIGSGAGAIAYDDIRITDSTGKLVVSENAEGPSFVPGPLNWQLTDATTLHFKVTADAMPTSAVAKDLDGDGYPEVVFTLLDSGNDSKTPVPIVIMEARGQMRNASSDFFPAGVPTVKDSPMTVFADLNADGLQDIVFSEAGGDPFGSGRISVALNEGGGKYRDVSNLIPADQQDTRSYAIVVGDVLSDGQVRILLPDENDGANTALLRWNGDGFDEMRNWIPQTIWKGFPFFLHQQSWMNLADLDNDGKQDLLVSGQQNAANIQLVFGAVGGFARATTVQVLPDGPWGHYSPAARPAAAQGAEVQPIVVADFNNDGLADIFAAERKVVQYQPGAFTDTTYPDYENLHKNGGTVYSDDSFQVLINQGSRRFVDVTAPNYVNFGVRTYFSLLPIDVNLDGFLDIVGEYTANLTMTKLFSGTTFFLNDGTGRFQPVDSSKLLAVTTTPSNGEVWNLGSFVPTLVTAQRIEGVVSEFVQSCGGCFNVYKVAANGSISTGPNFVDPARFGVASFNEIYYLNQHPDVAAAVERGEYRSGLDHYLVEGRANGYAIHAPNARARP
jgi:hypothetical protein